MTGDLSLMLKKQGSCYSPSRDDIAVATSARLARNLSGMLFVGSASDTLLENLIELVRSRFDSLDTIFPFYFAFHLEPSLVREVVTERMFVSRKFGEFAHPRGVAISDNQSLSVLMNAGDHLHLRSVVAGFEPEKALDMAEKLDEQIGRQLEYAFDDEFGFITSSPKNFGTGLRISVLLHLPALVIAGHLDRATNAAKELGYSLKGSFGPKQSLSGHLFRLSSTRTLGVTEAEIASDMMKVVPSLISYEKKARETLMAVPRDKYFEDIVARSLGLLQSARMLSLLETLDHLSVMRLGAALGLLPAQCSDLLFDCLFDIQPAHLQVHKGREMDSAEQDVERSIIVRERISRALDKK